METCWCFKVFNLLNGFANSNISILGFGTVSLWEPGLPFIICCGLLIFLKRIVTTSCLSSLHSQFSDSSRTERNHSAGGGRGAGASGSSASLYGSLPRQAPPPVPPGKPIRDSGPSVGPQTHTFPTYIQNPSASPRPRQPDRDGSVRRGSFVERCQERAKGSEAAGGPGFGVLSGSDGVRRSLAVCSELEARFGLRAPASLSVSPGARHSPGTPSSLSPSPSPSSSSSQHRRATPTSPTSPAPPPPVSPTRSQAPVSPRHGATGPPADSPASPESPAAPNSPASGPPTSPKPHMNETSFWLDVQNTEN